MTTFGECLGEKGQERQDGEWAAGLQAGRARQGTARTNVLTAFRLLSARGSHGSSPRSSHRRTLRVTDRHAPRPGEECWKRKRKGRMRTWHLMTKQNRKRRKRGPGRASFRGFKGGAVCPLSSETEKHSFSQRRRERGDGVGPAHLCDDRDPLFIRCRCRGQGTGWQRTHRHTHSRSHRGRERRL